MTSPALLKPPRAADKTPNQGDVNIRWVDVADAISRMFFWSYEGGLAMVGSSLQRRRWWVVRHIWTDRSYRFIVANVLVLALRAAMVSNMSNAQKVATIQCRRKPNLRGVDVLTCIHFLVILHITCRHAVRDRHITNLISLCFCTNLPLLWPATPCQSPVFITFTSKINLANNMDLI